MKIGLRKELWIKGKTYPDLRLLVNLDKALNGFIFIMRASGKCERFQKFKNFGVK